MILCDARGVHDIPTAEWAVTAVLAMQKYLPFYVEMQKHGDWYKRSQAREIYRLSHPNNQIRRRCSMKSPTTPF